jgi:hypothetical protein
MLKLETKVNIILVLLLLIIGFHILFFIKPKWFNFKKWLNLDECEIKCKK